MGNRNASRESRGHDSRKPHESDCRVSVIGGGSFGTVIANLMGSNGHPVTLWLRDETLRDTLNGQNENTKYFPGVKLSANIHATTNLEEAVRDKDLIFVSIPSKAFRDVSRKLGDYTTGRQSLISTTKGIEPDKLQTMCDVLLDETCCLKVGALSGPNLAGELLEGHPTGITIASAFDEVIEQAQKFLAGPTVRVYPNHDVRGVELGGTLKNIYAICSGIISAQKYGDNTRSLMMTRAIAEMSRFAGKLGSSPMTFIGLAGMGDLIATCSSPRSRNFQVGFQLGSGKSLEDAVAHLGQTAEGVGTIKHMKHHADRLGVYMPILQSMYRVLYENQPVPEALKDLMASQQQRDIEFQTSFS